MKNAKQGLLLATLILSQPILACTQDGREGFLPKNNLYISTAEKTTGITEEVFNSVIDKVEVLYAPVIANMGATLRIDRKWADGTVNAYAQQTGSTWIVSMFGGLARHSTITSDGFALVACHELGHHIGGAPRYYSNTDWASNEGQSDYFATLKCLRRMWLDENNEEVIAGMNVPKAVTSACSEQWPNSADRAICIRGAMAGDSVAKLFASFGSSRPAQFDTPDARVVSRTSDSHPATQCRLDTYFRGALCEKDMNEDVSRSDEVTGTCHGSTGHTTGLRPLCWFRPRAQ
jgi:hypothetical protein